MDRAELRELVTGEGFVVEHVRLITPRADVGVLRVVAKASRMTRTDGVVARLGLGGTIILSARAR